MNDRLRRLFRINLPDEKTIPDDQMYRVLYRYESRRIKHLANVVALRRYLILICIPFVFFPILFSLRVYSGQEYKAAYTTSYSGRQVYYESPGAYLRAQVSNAAAIAFGISLCFMFGADLFALIVAVIASDYDRRDDYWDLLRLSMLNPESVVASKQAIGQTYAWRVTAWEIGLRATVTTLLAISTITLLIDNNRLNLFDILVAFLSVIGFGAWLIYEPYWRLQSTVAVGLRIAARQYHPLIIYLNVAARALLLWIGRIFILMFVGFAFLNVLFIPALSGNRSDFATGITVIGLCGILFIVTQSYYMRIVEHSSYIAAHFIFRRESRPVLEER